MQMLINSNIRIEMREGERSNFKYLCCVQTVREAKRMCNEFGAEYL